MGEILFENNFKDLLTRLIGLSDQSTFVNYLNSHQENLENCRITDDNKTIEYHERNRVTGEWEHLKYNIDESIYSDVSVFTERSMSKIIPHLKEKSDIKKSIGDIDMAINRIEQNNFYDSYPRYKQALIDIRDVLNERLLFHRSIVRNQNTGAASNITKEENARKLKWVKDMIEESGDHETAVQKIKNKLEEQLPEFSWAESDGRLFFISRDKINQTSVCKLIKKIANEKWGENNAPGHETIKKVLFKEK